MRRNFTLAWMLLLTFGASTLFAQTKPDFTGDWKLNKAKSELGPLADRTPDDLIVKINHKEPELKTSVQGPNGQSQESSVTINGQPTVHTDKGPMGEVKSTATAKWDGDVLLVDVKREMGETSALQSDRWSLSGDKNVLTIARTLSGQMGTLEMKQVLEKQ